MSSSKGRRRTEGGGLKGREAEVDRLRRMARHAARGWGSSVLIWGPPGRGKTALVASIYRELALENKGVMPFYYQVPEQSGGLGELAEDIVRSFALAYEGHRNNAPSGTVREAAATAEVLQALTRGTNEETRYLVSRLRQFEGPMNERSLFREAALLPARFAGRFGLPVFVILDDLPRLASFGPAGSVCWPKEALTAKTAPVIATGRSPARFREIVADGQAGAVAEWPLTHPSREGAFALLQGMLRSAGLTMDERLQGIIVRLADGGVYPLEALVRSVEGYDDLDAAGLYRAYADLVCGGELGKYWMAILESALPEARLLHTAMEVLVYLLREEREESPLSGLADHMLKPAEEVEEATRGLRDAGLLEVEGTMARVCGDATFRDVVFAYYRREGEAPGTAFIAASLAAEKMRNSDNARKKAARDEGRAALRNLLQGWKEQKVPRLIFSAAEFNRRYAGEEEKRILTRLDAEEEVLRLPTVISVASGTLKPEAGYPACEVDGVAWALRPGGAAGERDVIWLVRITDGAQGSESDVERFEQSVGVLRTSREFAGKNTVKWLISAAGFTREAVEKASRLKMLTSTFRQVAILGELIGKKTEDLMPVADEKRPDPAPLEFEMVIPMVSETELVAARAVEQLAENMNFDATEIGRIKMALVEACINAFEHSGADDGKVNLRFLVQGGCLSIRVENRGKAFDRAAYAALGGPGEMQKRGWGINLIRELMDEVDFEPIDEGTALVMVKRLIPGKDGGGG